MPHAMARSPTPVAHRTRHAPSPPLLPLALVLVLALAACGERQPAAGGSGPAGAGGAMPPMPVRVVQVREQSLPATIEAVGTLEGVREVEVRPRVGGLLEQQLFSEGQAVRAGAPLYRIERVPLAIARDETRAAVAQQEVAVEQARREHQRLSTLLADGVITQRDADNAASTLKAAEAALQAARARLRESELNLGYAEVTAPIAGLAQRSQVSVGTLLSPTAATPLTTIVQVDPIRVRFALTAEEAQQVRRAGGRTVRLLGEDGRPGGEAGRLDFTGAVVDARLGTVQMRAEFANRQGEWLPGQAMRVVIAAGEHKGMLVPQAAVMRSEQGRFVWVMSKEGQATIRPVATGGWVGSDWVIRSGLAENDRVIVDNLMKLRPGAPVQAAAEAASAAGQAASSPAAAASR